MARNSWCQEDQINTLPLCIKLCISLLQEAFSGSISRGFKCTLASVGQTNSLEATEYKDAAASQEITKHRKLSKHFEED